MIQPYTTLQGPNIQRYRIKPYRNFTDIDTGYTLTGKLYIYTGTTILEPFIHRIQPYLNHLYIDTGYNRIGTIYT